MDSFLFSCFSPFESDKHVEKKRFGLLQFQLFSFPWAVKCWIVGFAYYFAGLPSSYVQSLQCPEYQTGHAGTSGGVSSGSAPWESTTKVLHCFVTTSTPSHVHTHSLDATASSWMMTQWHCTVYCHYLPWEHSLIDLVLSLHIYRWFSIFWSFAMKEPFEKCHCIHVARIDLWCVFSLLIDPQLPPPLLHPHPPPPTHCICQGHLKLCHVLN